MTHGLRTWLHAALTLSMTMGAMLGLPPLAATAVQPDRPADKSVPVAAAGAVRAATPAETDGPGVTKVDRVILPGGGAAQVTTNGTPVSVGGLPVSARASAVEGDDFLSGARLHAGVVAALTRVNITVAEARVAQAAGVRGVVLSVSRVDGDTAEGDTVEVTVDYAAFSQLYGGNYADRLKLVQLPACVLTTPEDRRCQAQRDLGSVNTAGQVSAQVALSDMANATLMPGFAAVGGDSVALTEADGPTALAVTAGSSSLGGTFERTSLSSSYSWAAGGQGGSFSWSYPLRVPASLGGPAPEVALAYDSGSVDGRTLAANGQASWVGDGWDLAAGGFVERSYRSCAQDGATGSNAADLCWFSTYNATLTLGGRSFKLIRDEASGVWKTDDDNGWRVEQRFGGNLGNGDYGDEHWVVTTLDGVQYWFGRHKRYSGDTQVTNSVQVVPVWGNHAGEPCNTETWCMQGYRWNLDYVVDLSGNSMTYFYTEFQSNYGFNNNQQVVGYDLWSYLDHIDYGTRAGTEAAGPAPVQVWFNKALRCIGGCSTSEFPDTPWDLHCASSTSCPNVTSPAFWNPFKLTGVYTQVRKSDGSGYRKVNQWDLGQAFPPSWDYIAPTGQDDTSPHLWLQTLTHTGYAADGVTTLAEPTINFGGTHMFNRVDWGNDIGVPPYVHYRLTDITNGMGGQTLVAYSAHDCPSRSLKPSPGWNPYRCFPQHFKPAQAAAGYGWFHKYVATSVTEKDLTAAGTPDEVWSYSYGTEGSTDVALWGHDFNETVILDYRSWGLWRGYTDVTTTHGLTGGTQTVSKGLWHRGMSGDSLATWDSTAMLWDARRVWLSAPVGVPGQTSAIGGRGGKCLNLQGSGAGNGTLVELWDCIGHWGQQWVYNLDTGAFKNPNTGRCLDLQGAGTANGTRVQLWDCHGGANQRWLFRPEGGLVNPVSGRCLDIYGAASATNGAVVDLWDCGDWNQVWQSRADATLQARQDRRCIDVAGAGTADGTPIRSWTCDGGIAQQWTYATSGSSLKNPNSGKCLEAAGGGTAAGTLIQLFTCNGSTGQVWVPQSDGTLKNPNSGRCLDATGTPSPGTVLRLADCTAGLTQQWASLVTDALALQGKPREQFTQDGSTLLGSTITGYTVTHTGTRLKPIVGGQDLKSFMARPTEVKTRTYIQATGSWRWTRHETTFDSYGLPATQRDHGDLATTNDDTCVNPTYNRNTTLHLIGLVKEAVTTSCGLQAGDADILSGQHFFYDNATTDATPTKGLVTKTDAVSAVSGGAKTWLQQARTVYDANGRVLEAYDALDRKTTSVYTPAAGAPVTSVAVTGPMGTGWTVTTDVEPGHGTPTRVTDANGKTTIAQYDSLGRLTKVWRDNRTTTTTPNVQYTYTLSSNLASPSWIRTQTLGPNGNQIDAYDIFDGRLKLRQTQTPTESGHRQITDVQYDGRGLQAKVSVFYNNSGAPTSGLMPFSDANIERQTRYIYDGLVRQTKQQLFKNNVLQFESTTVYDGDRTGVIPPQGGTVTQDLTDARGKVIEKRQYQSPTSLSGAFDRTIYGYDRQGQLVMVTDPANNTWTYQYDLLGRKTHTVDPDAGTTVSTYDNAGQVTSTTDARSQALFYEYDLLGRKTRQRDGSTTGPVMAEWTYDTVLKGQPAASIRYVGADQYRTRVTSWDDGYRPLHTEVDIPNATLNGGLAATYAWDRTYKVDGSPATVVHPAVGGLPAETLTSTYDNNGFAQTLTGTWTGGTQTYLADTVYHYDGLPFQRFLGNPGKQVRLDDHYDGATRRPDISWVSRETSPGTFTVKYETDYSHDPAGNITYLAGKTDSQPDQTECFRHDHLRRLTEAWTQATLGTGCTTPQKTGADSYWRQWTFDSIGNRLTQTDKDTTAGDTTWTHTVGAAGSVKPHQLKQVDATGPKAGTPTRTFGYDPAGNLTTATTPTGTAQTLTWDKEGHLESVTETGATTSYVYGADGSRLIARTPSKTTLYLPDGTELEQASGGGTPLGTRYYTGLAMRTPSGLQWTIANHQNTSVAQIDATTLTATRRRMLPYGEDRGTQPSGWTGAKGYVGGTKDTTGYTHLGAREYDPTLGRFISVDPIMDLADPKQWHAYSYSNDNPVTFSDPAGLKPWDDTEGKFYRGDSWIRGQINYRHDAARDGAAKEIKRQVEAMGGNPDMVFTEYEIAGACKQHKRQCGEDGRADIVYIDEGTDTIYVWEVKYYLEPGPTKGAAEVQHYVKALKANGQFTNVRPGFALEIGTIAAVPRGEIVVVFNGPGPGVVLYRAHRPPRGYGEEVPQPVPATAPAQQPTPASIPVPAPGCVPMAGMGGCRPGETPIPGIWAPWGNGGGIYRLPIPVCVPILCFG